MTDNKTDPLLQPLVRVLESLAQQDVAACQNLRDRGQENDAVYHVRRGHAEGIKVALQILRRPLADMPDDVLHWRMADALICRDWENIQLFSEEMFARFKAREPSHAASVACKPLQDALRQADGFVAEAMSTHAALERYELLTECRARLQRALAATPPAPDPRDAPLPCGLQWHREDEGGGWELVFADDTNTDPYYFARGDTQDEALAEARSRLARCDAPAPTIAAQPPASLHNAFQEQTVDAIFAGDVAALDRLAPKLAAFQATAQPPSTEPRDAPRDCRDCDRLLGERDAAQECIDAVRDLLGIRSEWTNLYGYSQFVEEAEATVQRMKSEAADCKECHRRDLEEVGFEMCEECGNEIDTDTESYSTAGNTFLCSECMGGARLPTATPEPTPEPTPE